MMMASPTAASPAATVMMKIVKTCPSSEAMWLEKATRLMFTAFMISSMLMSTVIMLRRTTTPIRPTAKSVPESIRYMLVLGTHGLLHFLLALDPIDHVLRIQIFIEPRQLALADHDGSDHGHEQEERGNLEWHEIVGVERHPDRFGIAFDRPRHQASTGDCTVRMVHSLFAIRRDRLERIGVGHFIVIHARTHHR